MGGRKVTSPTLAELVRSGIVNKIGVKVWSKSSRHSSVLHLQFYDMQRANYSKLYEEKLSSERRKGVPRKEAQRRAMQSASAKLNAPQNKTPQQMPKKPKAKAQPQKQSSKQLKPRSEALSHLRRMNEMLRRPLPCGGRATRVQTYFGRARFPLWIETTSTNHLPMFLFHPCRSEHSVLYASGNSIFRNIQRDHSRTWLDDTLYFNEGSAPKISDLSAANLNGMLTSSPSFDVSGGQDVRPLGGYLVIKIDAGTTARGYMWTMPATQDDTAVSAYIIKSSAQTNPWVKRHEIKPGVNHYLIKAPLENRAALLDFKDRLDLFNWGSADAFGGVFVGFSGVTFAANDSAPVRHCLFSRQFANHA